MGTLNFTYGTMGSSKTANMLMRAYNYKERGQEIRVFKPSIDTRDQFSTIKSRIGLKVDQVEVISPTDSFLNRNIEPKQIVFIDEAQFLTPVQIEELRVLAEHNTIYCYGLLTDFKTMLFPGSKRLIELADHFDEIQSVCDCGRKTIINARLINGKPVLEGPQVLIGGNESYKAVCYYCYKKFDN